MVTTMSVIISKQGRVQTQHVRTLIIDYDIGFHTLYVFGSTLDSGAW
jgi:hypothetical protein